jgi:capsular polysaccharide biosynthesis protein
VALADIVKYMRAWWWIVLIVPLLAGTAGYVGSRVMTPTYQSTATLLVETDQPGSATHSDIQALERLSRTFSQLLTGREVLSETIAREGLDITAGSLRGRVSVSFVRDTRLIRISVRSSGPEQHCRQRGAAFNRFTIVRGACGRSSKPTTRSHRNVVAGRDRAPAGLAACQWRP